MKKNLVNDSNINFEDLFYYDPTSRSCLRSKCNRVNRRTLHAYILEGEEVGGVNSRGYWQVSIDHVLYKAHHIVWYLHNGRSFEGVIDHINRNPSDNRIENLRLVSQQENLNNGKVPLWAKIPVKGISFRQDRGIPRFVVAWNDGNVRKTKSFSCNGKRLVEEIFLQAVEYRKDRLMEVGIVPEATVITDYLAAQEFAHKLGEILYNHFPESMKALNYGEEG